MRSVRNTTIFCGLNFRFVVPTKTLMIRRFETDYQPGGAAGSVNLRDPRDSVVIGLQGCRYFTGR